LPKQMVIKRTNIKFERKKIIEWWNWRNKTT
jgi:hypothetical protein